jgi:hypothetical protein
LHIRAAIFLLALCAKAFAAESTCFGTVSNGRLENAVALPKQGANFSAYSSVAGLLGLRRSPKRVRFYLARTVQAGDKIARRI